MVRTLLLFLSFVVSVICAGAQTTKVKTNKGTNNWMVPYTETYNYYLNDKGEEVRHGQYTYKANGTFNGITCVQNYTITYKNGKFDGMYSATTTLTIKGGSLPTVTKGKFVNGVPTGAWTVQNFSVGLAMGSNETEKLTCSFENGKMTGSWKFVSTYNKTQETEIWKFNTKGLPDGNGLGEKGKMNFVNGVFIPDMPDIKEIAEKLGRGEITIEELDANDYMVLNSDVYYVSGGRFCTMLPVRDGVDEYKINSLNPKVTYIIPRKTEFLAKFLSVSYRNPKLEVKDGKTYMSVTAQDINSVFSETLDEYKIEFLNSFGVKVNKDSYFRSENYVYGKGYAAVAPQLLLLSDSQVKMIKDREFYGYIRRAKDYSYKTEDGVSFVMIKDKKFVLDETQITKLKELDKERTEKIKELESKGYYPSKNSEGKWCLESTVLNDAESEKYEICEKVYTVKFPTVIEENGAKYLVIDGKKIEMTAGMIKNLDPFLDWRTKNIKHAVENNYYRKESDGTYTITFLAHQRPNHKYPETLYMTEDEFKNTSGNNRKSQQQGGKSNNINNNPTKEKKGFFKALGF